MAKTIKKRAINRVVIPLPPLYTYEQYTKDFQKDHPNSPNSAEYSQRKALFEGELQRVLTHNADESHTYKMGVNQFSDLSKKERRSRISMFREMDGAVLQAEADGTTDMEGFRAALARVALPRNGSNTGYPGRATVDYRQNVPPVLTNVKDQGLCGCCWLINQS